MDKLRILKRSFAWWSVAVVATALSPAAFGVPEVTADQFTLRLVSGNPNGLGMYAPVLTPIQGTNGYGFFNDLSSTYGPDTSCLNGCSLGVFFGPQSLPDVLEINFTKPVSSATVQITDDVFNQAGVQAFNSSGQVITPCLNAGSPQPGPNPFPPLVSPGCVVTALGNPTPYQEVATFQFTVTGPGIAHLLAGDWNTGSAPVTFVSFSVPEPGALTLLALALAGLAVTRKRLT